MDYSEDIQSWLQPGERVVSNRGMDALNKLNAGNKPRPLTIPPLTPELEKLIRERVIPALVAAGLLGKEELEMEMEIQRYTYSPLGEMVKYADHLKAVAEAVAAERERCAKIAEKNTDGVHIVLCTRIAAVIRKCR